MAVQIVHGHWACLLFILFFILPFKPQHFKVQPCLLNFFYPALPIFIGLNYIWVFQFISRSY